MSDNKDWNKLTVVQLKEECTKRSIPTVPGKKTDLVSRILEHIKASQETAELLEGAEEPNGAEPDDAILDEDGGEEEAGEEEAGEEEAGEEEAGEEEAGEEEQMDVDTSAEGEKNGESEGTESKKDEPAAGADAGDIAKLAKANKDITDTKKIPLPEGVPDLPKYSNIQEARIAETRMRTVIVYPMDIEDMSNDPLQTMLATSQHFMVKFVQNNEKDKKGFVEMHFATRKEAREAAIALRDLTLKSGEHVVRQLEPDEAGTAYKSAVIDKIKPHLTHQIKKATDDYDTRVIYVHNLPDDMTDEKLNELFPEAKAVLTAMDENEKNKGYAYLSFETEEESEECIKKHAELKVGENRVTLHMVRDLKAAAGIEARRPFRRGQGNRGGRGGPRGGPGNRGRPDNRRGGGMSPMGGMRGGYRGSPSGGRGGRGGRGVPSLMNMGGRGSYNQGGRGPRNLSDIDFGYQQFQERKRRAMHSGYEDSGPQWKMGRYGGGYSDGGGYGGGNYGSGNYGGGNYNSGRW